MLVSLKNALVAVSAALTLSTVAIGAAVGPAHASSAPVQAALHA